MRIERGGEGKEERRGERGEKRGWVERGKERVGAEGRRGGGDRG